MTIKRRVIIEDQPFRAIQEWRAHSCSHWHADKAPCDCRPYGGTTPIRYPIGYAQWRAVQRARGPQPLRNVDYSPSQVYTFDGESYAPIRGAAATGVILDDIGFRMPLLPYQRKLLDQMIEHALANKGSILTAMLGKRKPSWSRDK